ncbi:MAG TPA: hypothetical protein VI670_00010 [Thermoanaerobaculia bacterium]
MALPKTYLETSVISYLTARPSRDLVISAHQDLTRKWWETRKHEFNLYVSVEVMNEIRRGDPEMAHLRVGLAEGFPVLDFDPRRCARRRDLAYVDVALIRNSRRDAHRTCDREQHGLFSNVELQTHCERLYHAAGAAVDS